MTKEANPEPSSDSITYPSYTGGGTVYIPNQSYGCNVCGGRGIVYGLDGKPYLCPKCGGNNSPNYNPWYPQIWCNTTSSAVTTPYNFLDTSTTVPVIWA